MCTEFVQLNHLAYSPDFAPSDNFLIRSLKYHLHGTWFTDDCCRGMVRVKTENSIFWGINSWEEKWKMHWCCRRICRQYIWYNMLTLYSQVAKLFDCPSYYRHSHVANVWDLVFSNSEELVNSKENTELVVQGNHISLNWMSLYTKLP